MALNTQLPNWLQNANTDWLRSAASSGAHAISQGFQAGLQKQRQEQEMALRLKAMELESQQVTVMNQFKLNQIEEMELETADMPLLNEYAHTGQMSGELRSPKSFQKLSAIELARSRSELGRKTTADMVEFNKRLTKVSAKDAATIRDMQREKKPESEIWGFLDEAEQRAVPQSAAITNARETTRLRREADSIRATDPAKADELLQQAAQIEAVALGANETIEMSTDAEGRPVARISRGAAAGKGGIGGATVATQTRLQQDIMNTVDLLDIVGDLGKNLQWKDVGAAGVAGEWVLDRLLPQFGVNTADAGRMDRRTKLKTLAQGSLRQISPDNRFTNEDRQRVEEIVPSSGIFESEAHAKQALATIGRVFARRNVRDRVALGQPLEMPKLTNEEIAAAVEQGLLHYDQAFEFLKENR